MEFVDYTIGSNSQSIRKGRGCDDNLPQVLRMFIGMAFGVSFIIL